jgi:uroporphyrinogen-III decarboxylase
MMKNSLRTTKQEAKRIKKKHRLNLEIHVTPCKPTGEEVESVKEIMEEVHAGINLQGNLSPCRLCPPPEKAPCFLAWIEGRRTVDR